jgi:ubiquitin-like 1-activating enzyme E1 A
MKHTSLMMYIHHPSDRSALKDAPKNVKMTADYPPLHEALKHKWTGLAKRQTKELNPAVVFTILGIFQILLD